LCFVVPGKVRMAGPPPWKVLVDHDVLLPAMVQKFVPHAFELADSYQERPRPMTFPLSCPKCQQHRDCCTISLACSKGWAGIRCPSCKSTCKSSRWFCPCAVPWHTCRIHSQDGHDCRPHRAPRLAKARSMPGTGVSRRRPFGQVIDRLGQQHLNLPERSLHAPPCKVLRRIPKTQQQHVSAAEVFNLHSLTLHALPIRASPHPGRPLSGDQDSASLHLRCTTSSSSSSSDHFVQSATLGSTNVLRIPLANSARGIKRSAEFPLPWEPRSLSVKPTTIPRGLKRSLVFQPGPKLKQRLLEIGPSCNLALPLLQVPDNSSPLPLTDEGSS
jgi:hypothetical protein